MTIKNYSLILALLLLSKTFVAQQIQYPITLKSDQTDHYHGIEIADPYRWLEDDNSDETKAWVVTQNKLTRSYLDAIPFRDKIKERLTALTNYEKYGLPSEVGEYLIYSKNDGLQNQAVYYIKNKKSNQVEILLDPNQLSQKGTVSASIVSYSKDNKYVSILLSNSGSDWQTMRIFDLASRKMMIDELNWVKFTGASWFDDGFFYARYPIPEAGKELTSKSEYHSIYYHQMGTKQSEDKLIFEDKNNPNRYHSLSITEDQKYAFLYVSAGTGGSEIYYAENITKEKLDFIPLIKSFEQQSTVIDNEKNKFIVRTNIDAPNYRLVLIDPAKPDKKNWINLIPESEHLLASVSKAADRLYVKYKKNVTDHIYEYNRRGELMKKIQLPILGSVNGFNGKKTSNTVYFQLNSHINPPTIYAYDISDAAYTVLFEATKKTTDEIISEQVFFKSKDGTQIPMFLIYKKGLQKDGNRPVLLYGYGGFDISLSPSYDAFATVIAENDGIYAIVNLRGGGEFGESWHKAGIKEKKQTVFDDFIAAAEFLISENYTAPEKLGIYGRSNGGLLVGACMTQRPDLFKVAFPTVGVLDMLRFHKFTVGWGWVTEYGSSDLKTDFQYLIKYSPLHNISPKAYPATLVLTSDHDDRVVPSHSFKFAATLQANQQGNQPTLIRIETNTGHGAGTSLSKSIETFTDMYSFFFYQTSSPIKY